MRTRARWTDPLAPTAGQLEAWQDALDLWGVALHDPVLVEGAGEASFAWFVFPSEVSVDLALLEAAGGADHLGSVFAHEIGHHVLAPGTRLDEFKVVHQMARAITALDEWSDGRGGQADLGTATRLANLWEDLLVNARVARLQRRRLADAGRPGEEPDIVALWRLLNRPGSESPALWWVYRRAHELVWSLPRGTFCDVAPPDVVDDQQRADRAAGTAAAPRRTAPAVAAPTLAEQAAEAEADARAARSELARLRTPSPEFDAEWLADTVRRFADDPVGGALPAGTVLAPYAVLRSRDEDRLRAAASRGAGTPGAGCGGQASDGAPTPAEVEAVLGDPRLRAVPEHPGVSAARRAAEEAAAARGHDADAGAGASDGDDGEGEGVRLGDALGRSRGGSEGQAYGLADTLRLWRGSDRDGVVAAWYLAEARRWVRPLVQPALVGSAADDTIPGALESWQLGDDVDDVDWAATLSRSPVVVPGVTTRRRDRLADAPPPPDEGIELDLWVDSSGSMPSPETGSAALVAGTILVLSVLRGGGRVRITSFSGPGQVAGGARPTRDRAEALRDLTTYFGGGTTFPLDLLASRHPGTRLDPAVRRHLVVLSDDGLESLFGRGQEELGGVAARVRRTLDTATLVLLGTRSGIDAQAAAAGYDVRVLPGVADAPRVCAALAAALTDPPRRPEETRGQ